MNNCLSWAGRPLASKFNLRIGNLALHCSSCTTAYAALALIQSTNRQTIFILLPSASSANIRQCT